MAWQMLNVTKANFDLTAFVAAQSVIYTHSAYGEISRLQFTVDDLAGTIDIDEEDEIVFTDGGTKVFAGYIRQLGQTDEGRSTARVYECVCQDYTSSLSDDVVDVATFRDGNESDKALITYLFSTFGTKGIVVSTEVQTLRATMGVGQEFFGLSLHEAMTAIEKIVGASFYVDFDKRLHHYVSESLAAAFNLSDNPNYSTTFEYEDFSLPRDSVELVNSVFVVGDGVSAWRYKNGTPPAAGARRAAIIRNDELKTIAQCNAAGDAHLAAYSDARQPGSLVTYRPGLRGGMTIQITHAGHGITAQTFRIQNVEARPETKDRVRYTIRFGSKPITLGEVLGRTVGEVARLASGLSVAQAKLADLSIAGANLVPNSNFEDGTSWSVGAQWAIGVDPTSPDEPYAGVKVGRAVLAAQVAGNLVTPFIAVDATDDYWISLWRFIRSRTSGTFRIYVEEANAASTILRTTTIDFTAADTEWRRQAWHFGPAASADVIAWMPTTAKIRLGVNSAGAAATLSVDVDAAQVERSKILTAYAPSPTDLLSAPITSTQIADDAITTPKLAANAVVASKIAAGTITGDKIAAGTITADRIAAGGPSELTNSTLSVVIDSSGITIADEFMRSVLGPAGFEGEWSDFIQSGIYNSTFRGPAASTVDEGRTADLPYWLVDRISGSATISLNTTNGPIRVVHAAETSHVQLTSDRVRIRPRARYMLGFRHQNPSGQSDLDLTIKQYNGAGTLLTTTVLSNGQPTGSQYTGVFLTEPTAYRLEVIIDTRSLLGAASTDDIYFVHLLPADFVIASPTEQITSGASLTLTTSPQAVAGTSFTPLQDRTYLVIATFDFNVSGSGVGVCVGDLWVNGGSSGQQALFSPAATGRGTATQAFIIVPADHFGSPVELRASKTINAGTAAVIMGHTTLVAIPIG